jgi:glycosidase
MCIRDRHPTEQSFGTFEEVRLPFQWKMTKDNNILNYVKLLINLRKKYLESIQGTCKILSVSENSIIMELAPIRSPSRSKLFIAINNSHNEQKFEISRNRTKKQLSGILGNLIITEDNDCYSFVLPGYHAEIITE